MGTTFICFVGLLILSMANKGLCFCSINNIQIGTVRTGKEISGKPEWAVTVTNNCNCLQKHVTLSCQGFNSVTPVQPWILLNQGGTCLLIKGEALPAFASVHFSYAGDPYIFRPVGSTVDPSCQKEAQAPFLS